MAADRRRAGISPHPRDYRQGLFKFMSVNQARGRPDLPPRRDDLLHTLKSGIEGTAMPSFVLHGAKDLNYLVSYIIHLSLRGKIEFEAISGKLKRDKAIDAEAAKKALLRNVKDWVESQEPANAIQIPPDYDWHFNKKDPRDADGGEWQVWKKIEKDDEKWRIRGAIALALFNNEEPRRPEAKQILALRAEKAQDVKCAQCHTDYGRQAKFKFDSWATLVRPNNFTNGVFRGGRRPVDIYYRIHSGINGSNMPAFGAVISSNSIWDMVEFVQALSYPAMRKKLGVEID